MGEMKTLVIAAVLGAAMLAGFAASRRPAPGGSGIGTHPGNIGKTMDILKAARDRGNDLAIFAGGCFWGTEALLRQQKGVIATAVGYTGGDVPNPTYEQVCGKHSGHTEATLVEFDPKQVSYEKLVETFFDIHSPTQANGQGPDIGNNYRPGIFYFDEHQKNAAQAVKDRLQKEKYKERRIATEVTEAGPFYMAEDYHQQYFEKRGIAPTCHTGG